MKIESPCGQSINFWDHSTLPKKPKHIGLQLSGGIDSAALTLLMFDQFRDSKIHIITMNGMGTIESTPYAEKVLNFASKMFPEVKYTWDQFYGSTRPDCLEQIAGQGWYKDNNIEVMVTGACVTPPESIIQVFRNLYPEENYSYDSAIRDRDASAPEIDTADHTDVLLYRPFKKVNKFFTKYIIDRYNATDVLKFTRTCGRLYQDGRGGLYSQKNKFIEKQFFSEYNRDSSKPCRRCCQCLERKWAFGTWDGAHDYSKVNYNEIHL